MPSSETEAFDLKACLKDEDEEIRILVEGSVPVYSDKQRCFKWGGCGTYRDLSLQPFERPPCFEALSFFPKSLENRSVFSSEVPHELVWSAA